MSEIQPSELLQEIEKLGQIGGWAYHPASHILSWTDQVYSVFELPQTCPIDPEFIFSFFKGNSGKIFKSAFDECHQNRVPFRLKLPIHTFTRKMKWIQIQGRPIIRNNVCIRIQGAIQDISEQMQLTREREIYNYLSYELFSVFNSDCCWVQASQNWKESIGIEPTVLIGQEIWSHVVEEDRERLRKALFKLRAKSPLWNFETRLKTAQGNSKWFSWNISFDADNHYYYATCRNVDDLIQKQKNLEQNLDRSLDKIRAQDEFLSLVSHELRTPLVPILGYCQLLKDDMSDPETIASLEEIESAGRSLEKLIQELLELSQVRHGKPVLRLSQFSLFDLLNNLISRNLKAFHQKALSFNIHENDVLEEIKHVSLINDAKRIQKILERFISNALRFTDRGGALLKVTHAVEAGWYRVTVVDSGNGISAYDRDKIFAAFHQTEKPDTKRHSGLGIGLSIVKQLANHIDARIGFESHIDEGSEFWVEFESIKQDA